MNIHELNNLDNSISSFEFLKKESEKYWENVKLIDCWGHQIQQNSKWKNGLSERELDEFQAKMEFDFPESLKNYFRTMNGLDKPGVNINNWEEEAEFGVIFYSYPDDIDLIKEMIEWVREENEVTLENVETKLVPNIFPYYGHRFLILDNQQTVLSMWGADIIYWAENLSRGIAQDIFKFNHDDIIKVKLDENEFWNKKVL
jgi:hypothetical protein